MLRTRRNRRPSIAARKTANTTQNQLASLCLASLSRASATPQDFPSSPWRPFRRSLLFGHFCKSFSGGLQAPLARSSTVAPPSPLLPFSCSLEGAWSIAAGHSQPFTAGHFLPDVPTAFAFALGPRPSVDLSRAYVVRLQGELLPTAMHISLSLITSERRLAGKRKVALLLRVENRRLWHMAHVK